ncbi:metal-dependent amidase/aminoacylase/carboxypeptidase family protein [Streptacidiphilus sp. MAP12-20]|uniref:hypothetical protein n=1 Tax=Streptacidiphilus sp. MAP12-20 TaxID=3156299 RepID=UPI003515355D
MSPTLAESAALLQPELAALRRELHREPEIGLELPLTQARVVAALRQGRLDPAGVADLVGHHVGGHVRR